MKIYYHIHITGQDPDADLISVGMVADNGISAYFEANDYSPDKVEMGGTSSVCDDLLGRYGIEDLIISRRKTKGVIAPGIRIKGYVNDFLSPYSEMAFISMATQWQASSMIQLLSGNNASKMIHLISLPMDNFVADAEDICSNLPQYNALRLAFCYKEHSDYDPRR